MVTTFLMALSNCLGMNNLLDETYGILISNKMFYIIDHLSCSVGNCLGKENNFLQKVF